jgi:hypothetical protein
VLLELADAVLCADRPVRSLVQLSLEPEFRRGHGALYDALAAGAGRAAVYLLTEVLPPLVGGPKVRAWTAGHDVIDRPMLHRALSGVPTADAARVRDACGHWRRVRVAVDATSYPRPDSWCSPGREHVHHGFLSLPGSSKTTPGWEYQLTAIIGYLRKYHSSMTSPLTLMAGSLHRSPELSGFWVPRGGAGLEASGSGWSVTTKRLDRFESSHE